LTVLLTLPVLLLLSLSPSSLYRIVMSIAFRVVD